MLPCSFPTQSQENPRFSGNLAPVGHSFPVSPYRRGNQKRDGGFGCRKLSRRTEPGRVNSFLSASGILRTGL